MQPKKLMLTRPLCLLLSIVVCNNAFGQTIPPATPTAIDSSLMDRITALENQVHEEHHGEDHFMVVGLTTIGFVANKTTATTGGESQVSKTNSFPDATDYEFSPMFLWRHGDKWLMEFEPSFTGGTLGVNWADVSYYAVPGLIIRAGYFVQPFGTYAKREAAGWIDKLATDPLGIPDLPPQTDFGIEVEGGLPMGNMKWSYDIALTNGNQLLPDGEIQNAGIVDNNNNKTVTARLGLMPFSNSSLELGISGMFGNVADAGSSYLNANSQCYALDLNYVHTFNPIQVNVKGQYNYIHINPQQYSNPNDSSNYTFDNTTRNGFIQGSFRPVGSNNKFLKNLELAVRYTKLETPKNSLWGATTDVKDIGLDYWLTWRTVLKLTYETSNGTSTVSQELGGLGTVTKSNSLYLQFSIQL
jgi:hypothetical protein